jgi:hypothetical protein
MSLRIWGTRCWRSTNPFKINKKEARPFFSKLMMNQLLSNTESAVKVLVEEVGKYNIGNIQGEEVTKVTSQIASAIHRLKKIRKLTPKGYDHNFAHNNANELS